VGIRPGQPPPQEQGGNDAADEGHLVACAMVDPRAFEPLYRRYAGLVFGYCSRRLGSREAAEDATSLVFMHALKALPNFRGGTFRIWLLNIAQNVITDSYRRTRPTQPFETAELVPDPAPAPEEIALLADERRLLQAALALLPADERRVMELRLSGLRATEIAVVLDRSAGSVRQLQLRAIRRLQTLLGVQKPVKEARDA
jgi:RNA polymerase sigma-70 factor, ECF subfamily